ncbi:hypothetical protein LBMAG53_36270 [Planctomycetota bacterium]|nr:hypothetical protein LBMAG53_36270 [Planctomycetota bacterium]
MRLIADCGNTNVKLAVADSNRIEAFARLPPDPAKLSAFFAVHDDAITSCVALPGSKANSEIFRKWWKQVGKGRRRWLLGTDITVPDLGQYPGIGLDRVVAGLAACLRRRQPQIIIDAGTATTITAWHCADTSAPPGGVGFLGGLILPGARTAIAGLATLAPALPAVDPHGPESNALQHSTVGAIGAAMGIGYGPMVAACLVKLERETGIKSVVATGGNCDLLIQSNVINPDQVFEHLVVEGVALLAG